MRCDVILANTDFVVDYIKYVHLVNKNRGIKRSEFKITKQQFIDNTHIFSQEFNNFCSVADDFAYCSGFSHSFFEFSNDDDAVLFKMMV